MLQNLNTKQSLERIRVTIREKLRYLNGAPSVQMQEIPPDLMGFLADEERNKEEREEEEGNADAVTRILSKLCLVFRFCIWPVNGGCSL
jgi:histone deacetylase HOS2